jgi:hypothetical protein
MGTCSKFTLEMQIKYIILTLNSIKIGTLTPAVFLKPKLAEIEGHLVGMP